MYTYIFSFCRGEGFHNNLTPPAKKNRKQEVVIKMETLEAAPFFALKGNGEFVAWIFLKYSLKGWAFSS